MARQDWAGAVSNLWVIAEQLTAYLWSRDVIDESKADSDPIVGRRPQLEDSRTWTAANRQELLYQKGSFGTETLRALYVTRKSRNDLVHEGRHPDDKAARSAFACVKGLFDGATHEAPVPLFRLNLEDHALSDPFQPRESGKLDVKYWMPFPKLPSEDEIDREERGKGRKSRS